MRFRHLLIAGALLLLPGFGCGYLRAEYARGDVITKELDAYVIRKPIAEVWASATKPNGAGNLAWKGQLLTWTETGPWQMRTESRTSKESGRGNERDVVTWFECEAKEVPGGTQVHYFEKTEATSKSGNVDRQSKRRIDLELELVKHFDPPAALRIEAAGDRAARNAE